MSDSLRYTRQTSLKDFGAVNQAKLTDSQVLVVGLGGLGIPVVNYLNAMGVGTLGIIDNDVIEIHNLQRQVLYTEADIGKPKLDVIATHLKKQNSNTRLKTYPSFLTANNALAIIKEFDVVVDATDNFATRYLINDACVILNKPFVYGALHNFEGQISVFNYQGGPTYRCLFPNMPKPEEIPNCDENGVLGVVPGIIGTLQALETIKVVTGIGETLSGKLLLFDGLQQSYQKITFQLKPENLKITKLQDYNWIDPCEITPSVKAETLPNLLQEKAQIIDVRTLEEYAKYHLPETIHIPLAQLETAIHRIDFSNPVYLLCQSGKRSVTALKLLQENHPKSNFYSVLGGINQYLATCS